MKNGILGRETSKVKSFVIGGKIPKGLINRVLPKTNPQQSWKLKHWRFRFRSFHLNFN